MRQRPINCVTRILHRARLRAKLAEATVEVLTAELSKAQRKVTEVAGKVSEGINERNRLLVEIAKRDGVYDRKAGQCS